MKATAHVVFGFRQESHGGAWEEVIHTFDLDAGFMFGKSWPELQGALHDLVKDREPVLSTRRDLTFTHLLCINMEE